MYLVHASDLAELWGVTHLVRLFSGFPGDFLHGGDKLIDILFAFGLSRFDHYCPMDNQREINCWWVKTIIDQPFGHVQGGDLVVFLQLIAKNTFVHTWLRIRKVEDILELFPDVVSVEHCQLAGSE